MTDNNSNSPKQSMAARYQAKDSVDPIRWCQDCIWLYPARWALKDAAFEQMKKQPKAPIFPKTMLGNNDYEPRRLRDGYIYIMTSFSDCVNLPHTTEIAGKSWYIYYCHSDNNQQYFYKWTNDNFNQWQNSDNPTTFVKGLIEKVKQGKTHIELNRAIGRINILYSEFLLPNELLHQIATDTEARQLWMKSILIDGSSNGVYTEDIRKISDVVYDLAWDAKLKTNYPTNIARDFAIGKLANAEALVNYLSVGKGFIVTLEDPLGTAKDLHGYIHQLDDEHKETLKQYEYSLVTAQLIDSYANSTLEKLNKIIETGAQNINSYSLPVKSVIPSQKFNPPKLTLKEAYQSLNNIIDPIHLENKENDEIVMAVKKALGISGKVTGCNTINKLAKLPNLFNDEINNLVRCKCDFLNHNSAHVMALFALYEKEKSAPVANAACQYFDGLIRHLNYTTLGQQALIMLFNKDNDVLNPEQKKDVSQLAEQLKSLFDSFQKCLGVLPAVADSLSFNIYAFDRIIRTICTEIVLAGSYKDPKTGKVKYKRTQKIREIEQVYRKKGIFTKDELLSETVLKTEIAHLEPSRKKPTYLLNIVHNHAELRLQDADYNRVVDSKTKLEGALKILTVASILNLFSDEKYYTKGAQWANNATLTILLEFGEKVAPESNLEIKFLEKNKQISLEALNKKTGQPFVTPWQTARAGLFNLGTAFAGIGVVIEICNANEAQYKSDNFDYWGAVSRGTGATLISLAPALLGSGTTLATLAASQTNKIVALAATALQRVGIVFPYVGAALIVIGVLLSFMKQKDMNLWIKHSFWGKSERYWGNAVDGYDWSEIRDKNFKDNIFDHSIFDDRVLGQLAVYSYSIEMQRLFAITQEIELEVIDLHRIRVIHPNINSQAFADKIKINDKRIINRYREGFWVLSTPTIEFNEAELGQAVLHFQRWYVGDMRSIDKGYIPENDIELLILEVSLPRYSNATEYLTKSAELNMKGK